MVNVSLLGNPAGYRVGAVNTVSVTIGPASPVGSNTSSRQGVTSTASSTAPTVNLSVSPVVVVEGGTVTVTLTATPVPPTELEVELRIAGDVTVEDDYAEITDTVIIAAGATSAAVEVQVLVDDDLEPNEDLKVEIIGGFDDQAGAAPQTLLIYDLQVQVADLEERRTELADEIAEAEAGVQCLIALTTASPIILRYDY